MATLNELQEFMTLLNSTNAEDDAAFAERVATGMDLLELVDKRFGLAVGYSRPTVNRWRNRVTVPHPSTRAIVYDVLKERTGELIRSKSRDVKPVAQSSGTSRSPSSGNFPMAARKG